MQLSDLTSQDWLLRGGARWSGVGSLPYRKYWFLEYPFWKRNAVGSVVPYPL